MTVFSHGAIEIEDPKNGNTFIGEWTTSKTILGVEEFRG
jgi:hypothetical protein